MDQQKMFAQIVLSVKGIQAYLFSTGKLKEMIGASELTASFSDRVYGICRDLGMSETEEPADDDRWYVILQDGAGDLRLLVPDRDRARQILRSVSAWQIENYPGFPLYGTVADCAWEMTGFSASLQEAYRQIEHMRATQPRPARSVWPFCRVAPLDGLPAVCRREIRGERPEYLSAESRARRSEDLLDAARKRFAGVEKEIRDAGDTEPLLPPDVQLTWVDNMDDMLKGSPVQKLALLHMDGNDLGKLFKKRRKENEGRPVPEQIRAMLDLSALVDDANRHAFREALTAIVRQDLQNRKDRHVPMGRSYIVPARPLVLGGDDLTILIRADLSFDFADTYAAAFEAYTAEHGTHMSVGGGMVIMPSGYPFTRAFMMVEELTDRAKNLTSTDAQSSGESDDQKGGQKRKTDQTTGQDADAVRPSSIDYLVITNDVETDIGTLRQTSFRARDGSLLTGKPFLCGRPAEKRVLTGIGQDKNLDEAERKRILARSTLADVIATTRFLQKELDVPASHLRQAIEDCREGQEAARRAWEKLHENFRRDIGKGRKDALASFEWIFPGNFFFERDVRNQGQSGKTSGKDSGKTTGKNTGKNAGKTPVKDRTEKPERETVTLLGDYLELKRLFYPL